MNAAEVRARLAGRWPDHRYLSVYIEGEGGLTMCGLHVWDSCDGLPADDAQVCDRCVRAVEPPEPVLDTTSEPVVQTWT